MQQWKYIEKGLKPKQKKLVQKALKRLKPKMDKNFKNKDYQDYIDGELDIKVPLPDLIFGKGKEFAQLITAYSNAIKEPAFYEGKLTSEQKLRESIREIIKEQLNEAPFKKLGKELILPNDMKTKVKVSKIIKKLKLKIDKDYDVRALDAGGKKQEISVLKKHYDKFLELLMQNKIKVRG